MIGSSTTRDRELRCDQERALPSTDPSSTTNTDAAALATFVGARPRLLRIARKMLGNTSEAEDLVQEVWLRWQTADRGAVRAPRAFLATTTRRLAITRATSAQSRREVPLGSWTPEPASGATSGAERAGTLARALSLLLERLSPTERAAYVLREAFDYEYSRIAAILGATEANSRKLVARARKHLLDERRNAVASGEERELCAAFISAAHGGDPAPLEALFADAGLRHPGRTRQTSA